MDRLNFSDFYKFLVSTGLALLLAVAVFHWLLINGEEQFVSEESYNCFLPIDQDIYVAKRGLKKHFLFNYIYYELATIALAMGLLWFGLSKWRQKQKDNDDMEKLRMQIQIENPNTSIMPSEQESNKATSTSINQVLVDNTEVTPNPSASKEKPLSTDFAFDKQITECLQIDGWHFTHKFIPNKQIRPGHIAELLVFANNNKKSQYDPRFTDFILESISLDELNTQRIIEKLRADRMKWQLYSDSTKRSCKLNLFVILEDKLKNNNLYNKFEQAVHEIPLNQLVHRITVVSKSELKSISSQKIVFEK